MSINLKQLWNNFRFVLFQFHFTCASRFKLISCEIIFKVFQPMRSQYLNVTDGDGQTDRKMTYCGITALCVALCSKNCKKKYLKNWTQSKICALGSKRRIFSAPECILAVQGRSGSPKVDDFGTNRKRVYDLLLVGHVTMVLYCTVFEIWWLIG